MIRRYITVAKLNKKYLKMYVVMCEDYSSNFTFKISMFLSEAQKYMASKITES